MSYKVLTDPSGALLQDISGIIYRNYDVNYIPLYNKTYQLRNSVGKVVADNFNYYNSADSFSTPFPYLARDASNNIYVPQNNTSFSGNSVAKIVNNQLVDLNITLNSPGGLSIQGMAFDSNGFLYITSSYTEGVTPPNTKYSIIYKVEINSIESIVTQFTISNMNLISTTLTGLDFDSLGNLYIADKMNSNIIKIVMTSYSSGVGSIYVPNYVGLNEPSDIKFDQYDNSYIANSAENNIIKVTSAGVVSVFATGLLYPTELTFNFADSALYSTNYGYAQTDGNQTYLAKIVNGVVTNIKYAYFPYGIVATTTGDIYYTSSLFYNAGGADNTISIFKLTQNNITSNYANTIPYPFVPGTQSINPITSTAFDASQNLYAAQYTNDLSYNGYFGAIWKIPQVSPYNPTRFYPTLLTDPSLNNPTAIAFNNAKTYLYVANSTSNNIIAIQMSAPSGTIVTIGGVQLSSPSAIVFDGSGNLYVANSLNSTICILTFSSATAATSVLYDISGSPLFSPAGLDFDSTYANLYVSNAGYNNILKIPLSTNVASIYNLNGVSINSPSGIILDNSNNILYVSNMDTNEIVQITNNNTASNLSIVAGNSIKLPIQPITLNQPMGLTMDSSGNLYISNYANYFDAVVKLTFGYSLSLINTTSLYFPTDTAIETTYKNIFITSLFSPFGYISKLNADNVLTNYASTLGLTSGNVSLTINNDTRRLYVLDYYGNTCSINASGTASLFTISGIRPSTGCNCIRFVSPNLLYIADTLNSRILKVVITNAVSSGVGSVLVIIGIPPTPTFRPSVIAFDSSGSMYISAGQIFYPSGNTGTSRIVYKITNLNSTPALATNYITLNNITLTQGISGIAFDSENYMYTIGAIGTTIYTTQLYRTTPNGNTSTTELIPQNFSLNVQIYPINYVPWENYIVATDYNTSSLYKIYLSYPFTNMLGRLGPYDDTLFIFDITTSDNNFDVSFNVYTPYLVIEPRVIPANTPTNVSFHFVNPYVIPAPTDSYRLECNGTPVPANIFCNNCTYNKSNFVAGTYPTGLVYSTDTTYLYVALKNNTITRISALGIVDNNYFPPELGLVGPTSLVLDKFFDMFVLNAGSDFISFITLQDNIISVDNTFFTGIYIPICLTYDPDTDSLYLLSGAVPNTRITRINARTAAFEILPIPFGTLYDPNGLTIDAYYGLFSPLNNQPAQTKYLYISNQDQNKNNQIKRIDLTRTDPSGNLIITTLVSNLLYKPFTMANQNDGYLYVANKTANNISKISLTRLDQDIQPWAVNGISVPADLCFDNLGDLFIANSGTGPRNSRVSKIYTNYFFFTDVKLRNGTCDNAEIYDITTKSYVVIGYYPPPNIYNFPIPVPYPINS
jgi:DNA-binding beta-propeller fold protein YncE